MGNLLNFLKTKKRGNLAYKRGVKEVSQKKIRKSEIYFSRWEKTPTAEGIRRKIERKKL